MALPGWYPDPAHQAGQFRYWDGTAWSAGTTGNPADSPPGTGPSRPPRRHGWLIAAAALLVVLVVAFAFLRAGPTPNTTEPLPSTTGSGAGDRSPTAGPAPSDTLIPSPPPPQSPTPSPLAPSASQPCPVGDPSYRQSYPSDGRQHGGGLSFPSQSGWQSPVPRGLTWAYDVGGQFTRVQPEWFAMLAVGALSTVDGFEVPEQAAQAAMECTASSTFYEGFTERKDLDAEPVTIDGYHGWRLRSEVHVTSDATTLPGNVVEIIVLDLDSPESLAMFWGAVPIGDAKLGAQLDRVASQLRVG